MTPMLLFCFFCSEHTFTLINIKKKDCKVILTAGKCGGGKGKMKVRLRNLAQPLVTGAGMGTASPHFQTPLVSNILMWMFDLSTDATKPRSDD